MNFPNFERLEVKIVEKRFYASSDLSYPYTAIVSFYGEDGKFLTATDFGYLPIDQIYDKLEADGSLILDKCYVHNFSATAYRRSRILKKCDTVSVKTISARGALFNSKFVIDFSFVHLKEGASDFSESCFFSDEISFTQAIFGNERVDFNGAHFKSKKVDFSNAQFGGGGVIFKNAIFSDGIVDFQYADFGEGEINFVNVDFGNGDVSFINTNFNTGNALFKVARFGKGKVDFHFAKFSEGDISFERTEFGDGLVDFKTVEFGCGKVNFNRAVFGDGEYTFEASSAEGRITFKKAIFGQGRLNFELAEFENTELNLEKADLGSCELTFHEGRFRAIVLKGCRLNHYIDLRVRFCNEIDLSDTVVRDIVDLIPYHFPVDLKVLNIAGMRLLGNIYVDWQKNNVLELIKSQHKTTLAEKAEQFRILKESFNKTGQYNDEDRSYVWFKRYEMKANYQFEQKSSRIKRVVRIPKYVFEKILFDHAGLYATSPMRVMVAMVFTYVLFSLIYSFELGIHGGEIVSGIGGVHDKIGILGRSFYHSGVTFLTIGYGDFYPLGAVRWLSNVEGFIGVFLMSYFTVAFVRKILR
jgi:uncharacterized protein YjbI with pentapeptide repeats